jgi:hypothetical protein
MDALVCDVCKTTTTRAVNWVRVSLAGRDASAHWNATLPVDLCSAECVLAFASVAVQYGLAARSGERTKE